MFKTLNEQFNKEKARRREEQLIVESVVEDVLPGSDEDLDDITDPDSIPDDIYSKIDKELDKIVDDPNYDDVEASELIDGDDDDGSGTGFSDDEINAIMDESVNAWQDDENIHHPNKDRRDGTDHQPVFRAAGQKSL